MNKINWDEFKKTTDYQHLSDKSKQIIAYLYLEGIPVSEEFITDFILLDKGATNAENVKAKAIQQATC